MVVRPPCFAPARLSRGASSELDFGRPVLFRESSKAAANQGGHQVELIKLYGSIELAPLTGLADAIVDLVSTGNTLKANHLVAVEEIAQISARLIVTRPGADPVESQVPVLDARSAFVSGAQVALQGLARL